MGSEEFLSQIIEALGITIDRRRKERLRKREGYTIDKIGYLPIYIRGELLLVKNFMSL